MKIEITLDFNEVRTIELALALLSLRSATQTMDFQDARNYDALGASQHRLAKVTELQKRLTSAVEAEAQ